LQAGGMGPPAGMHLFDRIGRRQRRSRQRQSDHPQGDHR
jgi:hypothetical protein